MHRRHARRIPSPAPRHASGSSRGERPVGRVWAEDLPLAAKLLLRDRANQPACLFLIFRNVFLPPKPKSLLYPQPSHPTEGRIAIVTDAGLDAVDARASGTQRQSQGEMNLVSDVRRARRTTLFAYGKTVWSRHPLLVSSRRRFLRARPAPRERGGLRRCTGAMKPRSNVLFETRFKR
jgi:hypothetical protein